MFINKVIRILIICVFLTSCGKGDRHYVENTTSINCNANVHTSIIPLKEYQETIDMLDDAGAEILSQQELPNKKIEITYAIEQCNGNGNIDESHNEYNKDSYERK